MKYFILILISFIGLESFATNAIKLESIGFGRLLQIDGRIQLPTGQKLNKAAPSQIEVYEKVAQDWMLTEKVNLNNFFALSEVLNFKHNVKLNSDKAEIKFKASLYHCPSVGRGICVIDDYEGIVKRNSSKMSSEVQVALVGTAPK